MRALKRNIINIIIIIITYIMYVLNITIYLSRSWA